MLCCAYLPSHPTLCNPMDCSPPGSSVHGDSPGKNTGVGCHVLLQGIFPTQELNRSLLHCRQILYQLSYQGNPPAILLLVIHPGKMKALNQKMHAPQCSQRFLAKTWKQNKCSLTAEWIRNMW